MSATVNCDLPVHGSKFSFWIPNRLMPNISPIFPQNRELAGPRSRLYLVAVPSPSAHLQLSTSQFLYRLSLHRHRQSSGPEKSSLSCGRPVSLSPSPPRSQNSLFKISVHIPSRCPSPSFSTSSWSRNSRVPMTGKNGTDC